MSKITLFMSPVFQSSEYRHPVVFNVVLIKNKINKDSLKTMSVT